MKREEEESHMFKFKIAQVQRRFFMKSSLNSVKQRQFCKNRVCFILFKDDFAKPVFFDSV